VDQIRIESHLIDMRMAMHFTRFGRSGRDRPLPAGVSVTDLAIAQLLGLAQSAGFRFDVIEGRLVAIPALPDWRLWPTLRACLDEIGVDAIIAYFEHTTPERRQALSAPADLRLTQTGESALRARSTT
jgi:hypothetical protein